MSVRTTVLDLFMDPSVTSNEDERCAFLDKLEELFQPFALSKRHEIPCASGNLVVFIDDTENVTCLLKTLPTGLVTLTLQECSEQPKLTNQTCEDLKKKLRQELRKKVERIPMLHHGTQLARYFTSSDERVLEYNFDSVVAEVDSPYQNIKILHSNSLGNCLFLDDLQNLGENDLPYTHALMKYGDISYNNKEVLILGGGDGGLLHELLKENPKFVTMVDIDQMVIELCRKHLRGACGDSLDKLKGPNHEVIFDDCVKKLKEYVKERRKFDVVVNDLTDIPIEPQQQGELWDFIKNILKLSLQVLNPDGRYLNHATGENATSPLETYESVLRSLPTTVTFQSHKAYVPSFMEDWVFYEVRPVQ